MYKLTTKWPQRDDGASVNPDSNPDYLKWMAAGNVPTPADIPDPKLAILAAIDSQERAVMLPRSVREFMLGYMAATYTPEQLAGNPGYVKVKAFDGQMTALRASLK